MEVVELKEKTFTAEVEDAEKHLKAEESRFNPNKAGWGLC